jgi:hypothetical protein
MALRLPRAFAGTLVVGAGLVVSVFSVACNPTQAAAPPPTATAGVTPTVAAEYQVQVRMQPQDPRLGQDENVVIQATFRNRQGRGVPGAQISAVVNYPSGPKTYSSEITTFPDGRVDLAVPVAPATRGTNVRVEVVMRYQGRDYKQAAGFNVR